MGGSQPLTPPAAVLQSNDVDIELNKSNAQVAELEVSKRCMCTLPGQTPEG